MSHMLWTGETQNEHFNKEVPLPFKKVFNYILRKWKDTKTLLEAFFWRRENLPRQSFPEQILNLLSISSLIQQTCVWSFSGLIQNLPPWDEHYLCQRLDNLWTDKFPFGNRFLRPFLVAPFFFWFHKSFWIARWPIILSVLNCDALNMKKGATMCQTERKSVATHVLYFRH